MRQGVFGVLLALLASGGFAQTSITPSGGGGSSTITSGATATSGCVAGGVLRSISNMVECGAGLTYASNLLTVTAADAATNSVSTLTTFAHSTSGTAAVGFGSKVKFELEDAAGNLAETGGIGNALTIATAGNVTSKIYLSGSYANTVAQWFTLDPFGGTSSMSLPAGSFTVTNPFVISGNYLQVPSSSYGITVDQAANTLTGSTIGFSTTQTPDTAIIYTGATSNSWQMYERQDYTYDFNNGPCGTSACTDPALIIHSRNQSTTEYASIQHDGTTAQIKSGTGGVTIGTGTTGTTVPLTVNNGSSTGNTARFEEDSTNYLAIDNTTSQSSIIAQGGTLRLGAIDVSTGYLTMDTSAGSTSLTASQSVFNLVDGVSTLSLDAATGDTYWSNSRSSILFDYSENSTSAVNKNILVRLNPGNTSTGFGNSLVLQGQSSSTASQDMAAFVGKWSDATHASRSADAVIQTVSGAAALSDRNSALGKYTTLTETTATSFARVAVATGTVSGGDLLVTVEANDATDYQARTISVPWSAANKAGTLTLGLGTTSESVAASAGTLTCTITFVDATSGNADFKADCTSSLTQTTLRANAQVRKNFGTGAITAQ